MDVRVFAMRSARLPVAALCLLLLGLAACAPRLAVGGLEQRMPAIEGEGSDARYVTRDGLKLGLQTWEAENPKAVIVALHGMSDYSNAFAMPAPYWKERGITTYAYDQRGFGRSPNTYMWAGADVMRRDLSDFVDVVRTRHKGLPVFVLGESMGGGLTMTAFGSDAPPEADGIILVSPAVWGWTLLPFTYRATLWLSAHSVPWMNLTGAGLRIMPSDNIEMLRANGRDPLIQKRARVDAIFGVVNLMDEAYEAAPRIRVPALFMYGAKDQVIPNAPTKRTAAAMTSAEVKEYPTGYHMLLRDLAGKERWQDIADWALKIAASRPQE